MFDWYLIKLLYRNIFFSYETVDMQMTIIYYEEKLHHVSTFTRNTTLSSTENHKTTLKWKMFSNALKNNINFLCNALKNTIHPNRLHVRLSWKKKL